MRIVIIGGSDAGIAAALRARELAPDVDVTVMLADAYPNYSICGLPYLIGGEVATVPDLAHRTEFPGIDMRANHVVRRIDAGAKVIAYEHAGKAALEAYDRLIVATGAKPVLPAIAGVDRPGVFPLHTIDDGLAIARHLRARRVDRAVIVGGGYIGLEMAEALRRHGCDVTLLSRAPHVMPTLDASLGRLLELELERNGVRVVLGAGAASIADDLAVTDTLGERHAGDLVLLATGVRPDTELAVAAGAQLGAGDAIAISREMRTSLPHVLAAGDCAVTYHRMRREPAWVSLGTIAHKQGRLAGENALGLATPFAGVVGTQCLKLFDLVAARTGLLDAEAEAEGHAPVSVELTADDHKAYYPGARALRIRLTGDRRTRQLLGLQIVGPYGAEIAKRVDVAATALHWKASVERLVELDMSYSPPLGSPWDPVQLAAQAWLRQSELAAPVRLRKRPLTPPVATANHAAVGDGATAASVLGRVHLVTIPVAFERLRKWGRATKVFERRHHINDAVAARAALAGYVPKLEAGALEVRRKTAGQGTVHLYAAGDRTALMERVRAASGLLAEAGFDAGRVEVSPVPAFPVGERVSFKARLRPVAPSGGQQSGPGREFALTDVHALAEIVEQEQVDQFSAYRRWLSEKLAGAAVLVSFSILRVDELTLWMRNEAGESIARPGPDIFAEATVIVESSSAFARVVLAGVGACTGFGFGMVRLPFGDAK